MSATIRQIVDDALTVVGEVSGAGVQAYSEDRMFGDTIRAFNMLFKKYAWDQYIDWFTLVLDGATGKITTDAFTHVRDFEDIMSVHRAGQAPALPVAPKGLNPNILNGTSVLYWSALPATDAAYDLKKIRMLPRTATGSIDVCARVYPKANTVAWSWTDVMHLDKDMIVHGVAFLTLLADETNSSAAEGQRMLMEARFTDIKAILADKPLAAGGSNTGLPMEWFPR